MKPAVTVHPTYWGNPDTGERCEYVYVLDWNGLVKPTQLKGYQIHFKSSHYYDLNQERLIDFDQIIKDLQNEAAILRSIAEDKYEWFREFSDKQREEMSSIRPDGNHYNPPPIGVMKAQAISRKAVSIVGRLFGKSK